MPTDANISTAAGGEKKTVKERIYCWRVYCFSGIMSFSECSVLELRLLPVIS